MQASAEHEKLRQHTASPFPGMAFSAHKKALTKRERERGFYIFSQPTTKFIRVSNDLDGARAEHCGARVYLESLLLRCWSPQLLIPPHSVQAEASGGTLNHETSKGSPMKLYGLCASLDPVQE